MADSKKYVGKGRVKTFQNGGSVINIGIRYADLQPNERGYINLTVAEMRNPDDKGNTHTVYVNEYTKPQDEAPI